MKRCQTFGPAFVLACAAFCGGASAQVPVIVAPSKEGETTDKPVFPTKQRGDVDLTKGVPLIPRAVLFGNPDKAGARISPDGKMISYIAPVNGVMNVHVAPAGDLSKAKVVTSDTKRGIRQYFWAYDSSHIVYVQDKGGDENWRVYSVDVNGGDTKDLTPLENVAARIMEVSDKFPKEILVGLNDRNPQFHDVYRLNVSTGERTLVLKNTVNGDETKGYAAFDVDDDYRVRFAYMGTKDGGMDVFKASDDGKSFEKYDSIPMEDSDSTSVVGFDATGKTAYIIDSRGRDTAGLYAMDIATKTKKRLLEDPRTDVQGVMINPITKNVEAAQTNYERERWNLIDPSLQVDFFTLSTQGGTGDINVTSRSQNDRYWVVTFAEDDSSPRTMLMDRGDLKDSKRKPKLSKLFVTRPQLESQPLVPMHSVVIKARDGLEMVSYLSLPLEADSDRDGKPEKPVPMILNVHGGPWARDTWGFDAEAQWMANRGYAVLQVNFRGSTGFGKKHLNAANREWAGKMHDDLIDAVNWAVENKIADPSKVAIYGGSYGGYATLVGLTFTPDVFACGVDIVGPSNINTLLASIPPYWAPMIENMVKRVGDFRTEEGKKFLEERSPLTHVHKIKRPLLIGQGANDPRVKQAEADQIVQAMTAKEIPVTYVLYPDEGHGFQRPENRMSFYAVTEQFLAQHLGGRSEAINDAFKGSSIQVPTGAKGVPGLQDAISGHEAKSKP